MSATQAPGESFTVGAVDVDGFTVRYWEAGEGTPIVWLHGAGSPQFSRALDLVASENRVYMLELPGFGESALNDRTASAADMAATVAEVIRALGLTSAHVWGTSMGGVIATHLALDHPDLVDSLILEGPAPFRTGGLNPAETDPADLAKAFNRHPDRVAWRRPSAPDPARWPLITKIMGGEHDSELEARLSQIQAPTLALWGTDDLVTPAAAGRVYKEHVPHCSYVLVYDAAHDVQGDRPEACSDLVRDFVARGLNFVISSEDARVNP